MKKKTKLLIISICICLTITTIGVFALDSDVKTIHLYGTSYDIHANIWTSAWDEEATASTEINSEDTIKVGYTGLSARLLNQFGLMTQSTSMKYNDEAINGWSVVTPKETGSGYYYSKGLVKIYDGEGFTGSYTYATGMQGINLEDAKINKYGQTYGNLSECMSPYNEPDLIGAIGINGTNGYVLKSDLYLDEPKTPEQAIALNKKNKAPRLIPLYNKDGDKIIGEFEISPGKVIEK